MNSKKQNCSLQKHIYLNTKNNDNTNFFFVVSPYVGLIFAKRGCRGKESYHFNKGYVKVKCRK